ncbi:hypothetical protein MPSI1_001711 [Malassezia psittaci]|uniref:Uncharacterized protein n=1 Tax=Malassezia psittaci TaxID=1821823 RepID=A0AAF0F9Z5_9BASI|nr:hypothetical protein MPSI1_001711 [Malassezia psittaci]
MAIAKGKSGNALGLTSGKTRSSTLARGKPKHVPKQVEKDSESGPLKESVSPSTEDRVIPKWLTKLAEGKPELHVYAEKYDSLWEATEKKIGRAAGGLERWERARDIGADPPAEIADILNTKQGILDLRWSILERDLI